MSSTRPDLTPEQVDHLRALVARLEDPASRKRIGGLRTPLDDPEPAFCCLGHACDLSGLGEWAEIWSRVAEYRCPPPEDWEGEGERFWRSTSYLPLPVRSYYGLDMFATIPGGPVTIAGGDYGDLVMLNDVADLTLPEIARVIRERWLGEDTSTPPHP